MSYSAYGAFAFSKKRGAITWARDRSLEDRTLLAGKTEERALLERYGLKFDAVLHSMKAEADYPEELTETQKWNWLGLHHAILGEFEGVSILCYKMPVLVLLNGEKVLFSTDWDTPIQGAKYAHETGFFFRVKQFAGYTFALLRTPTGDEFAAFTGPGLGDDNFWIDADGYELEMDYETGEMKGRKKPYKIYPREPYFLKRLNELK